MTRYEKHTAEKLNSELYSYADGVNAPEIKSAIENGFKDIGSWYSVVRHDRFLYKKDNIFIYLTNNGNSRFNIEFLNSELAIGTLLKLKKVNELKYELNPDQISIDFYLDSMSLKEILENYIK